MTNTSISHDLGYSKPSISYFEWRHLSISKIDVTSLSPSSDLDDVVLRYEVYSVGPSVGAVMTRAHDMYVLFIMPA